MIKIVVEDIKLRVRVEKTLGNKISTNTQILGYHKVTVSAQYVSLSMYRSKCGTETNTQHQSTQGYQVS